MPEFMNDYSPSDTPATPVKKVRRGRPPRKPASEEVPEPAPVPQQAQLAFSSDPEPAAPKEEHPQPAQRPRQNRPQQNKNKQKKPQQQNQQQNKQKQQQKKKPQKRKPTPGYDPLGGLKVGTLPQFEALKTQEALSALIEESSDSSQEAFNFNDLYSLPLQELYKQVQELGAEYEGAPNRKSLLNTALQYLLEQKRPIHIQGVYEKLEDTQAGVLVHQHDNYCITELSSYIPQLFVKKYGLQRGHIVDLLIHPSRKEEQETCSFALDILKIMGDEPEEITKIIPFTDLIPYYPTERTFLETNNDVEWDNLSMRIVDILTPIGLGQRGLIVAPPRTGKTMLLQSIVHSIAENKPDAHIIVLLIDERPEEVTDFKRQVTKGEVISSTFDQPADSHVHVSEMVIEKSRRLVEHGEDVIIILDSITRLARAFNTMMPSSGKILSGGIEATSLRGPKRFFGSARNIEDGGSLTILASALIDTGSKMDEVIFEEFKGAGNMELHLDRELVNKRLFPAIAMDKSGTRKEELLYHPEEIEKIYGLRRAMKGVPPLEAMEMLIARVKKTNTNTEFLLGLNR